MRGSDSRQTVLVAARSKLWVCRCSLFGIEGSNTAEGMDVCLLWIMCVVSRSGPCVELIIAPEESYQVCRVSVWSRRLDNEKTPRPRPSRCCCAIKYIGRFILTFCWTCILINNSLFYQLDAQILYYIFYTSLHVSSTIMFILRRTYFISAASGTWYRHSL